MATFQELQEKLSAAKFRKAILEYVVEHLDSEFRPIAGGPSKKKILTAERVEVPQNIFETEVSFLHSDIMELDQEIQTILAATIVAPPSHTNGKVEEIEVKKPKKSESKQGEI